MRYDVLLEFDDRPHPLHFSTIYAANDDEARRLATERWLQTEPELRLQIVRVDGDRLVTVAPRREWHPAASGASNFGEGESPQIRWRSRRRQDG